MKEEEEWDRIFREGRNKGERKVKEGGWGIKGKGRGKECLGGNEQRVSKEDWNKEERKVKEYLMIVC